MTTHTLNFPQDAWIRSLVRQSLAEDVGTGDVSTDVAVDPRTIVDAEVIPRSQGIPAGLDLLAMVYAELDDRVCVSSLVEDGALVEAGIPLARITGPVASVLTGERTALNFLQYLSGIATETSRYVQSIAGTSCVILDTRKTLPGYRALAKYAVRCGGGHNHRFGLYDRIMLKDNHWFARRSSLAELVADARLRYPTLALEIEVDDLGQLEQVLPLKVDWVLLDNFNLQDTAAAVAMRNGLDVATRLESSGNVNIETVGGYALSGVDAVSVGRLTHSVRAWDLGLDFAKTAGDTK